MKQDKTTIRLNTAMRQHHRNDQIAKLTATIQRYQAEGKDTQVQEQLLKSIIAKEQRVERISRRRSQTNS